MDRAYKEDIPKYRRTLEGLRERFAGIDTKTDWVALRIDPLLAHVRLLERLLKSPKFKRETARLRRGVSMFHADLVHLRTNIAALKQILAEETRRLGKVKKH